MYVCMDACMHAYMYNICKNCGIKVACSYYHANDIPSCTSINDSQFLLCMYNLCKNCRIKVVCNHTNDIPIYTEVRKGYILSPLLFNLYINPLMVKINQLEHRFSHTHTLANIQISTLLFADDIVLLSLTLIGFK